MGKYDNYFSAIDQQQAALAAKLAEQNERGEGGTQLDPIRRFNFKKLVDKSPEKIGSKQYFTVLLMGYKPENGPFSLFRLRATHFNLPNPDNPAQDLIRDCASGGDASGELSCPFCEMVSHVVKLTNEKEKRATLYRMKARISASANAIPLSAHKREVDREQFPAVPHLIEITEQMLTTATEVMDMQGGASVVLNPKGTLPFFIEVERTGTDAQNVKYNCGFFAKPTPIAADDEGIEALYDSTYDLTRVIKFPSVEDIGKYKEEAAKIYEIWKKRLAAPSSAASDSPFGEDEDTPMVQTAKKVVKAPAKKTAESFQ